jgi:uncharacterized membrane protein SpoIIM required for sporulation/uncharacterized RDD family membrane protein YckC
MTAPPRAPLDLRQEHDVETPEHVVVRLELAGVGSRTAAMLLDLVVLTVSLTALNVVTIWALRLDRAPLAGWVIAVLILLQAFAVLGYFALGEAASGGRTIGKQALGIRTVMDTGKRVTPAAAVIRAALLLVDAFFPLAPALPGLMLMALNRGNKRLGDLAAGTVVVRDRPPDWTPALADTAPGPGDPAEPLEAGPPQLSDDEYRLLDQFIARMPQLEPGIQVRLQQDLVRRFEGRVPRRGGVTADVYLVDLFADEQRRRAGRFATRARTGAAGRTTVPAERFVARRREVWTAFDQVARRVERSGVGGLPSGEIPAFAARYREVAADLARARTYGVDPRVVAYLERLVSAGHNALYRARGRSRPPLAHYLLRDFPAAIVQSWPHVLAAFLLFAVPFAAGFAVIRQRPSLAAELVSPIMIDRVERAAAEREEGVGYAATEAETRPILSAAIIGNNVRVSFGALVGGMLAGTLTVWVLVVNGLMLGLGFGVFANYGAAEHLATFVVGHGVLELFAIFVSAGAGFRIAGAIIAPGDRNRRDALVIEGVIAARMIGAVASLLVFAGTIEGLLSTSEAPAYVKWGVGGVTAVLLALYLWNGARYRRDAASQPRQHRVAA